MSTATMPRRPIGKTSADAGAAKRKTAPIQIDGELAHMAAVIAAHDKKNITEIISPLIRQWLLTNYERVQKEIQERIRTMRDEDKRG